MVTWRSLTVWLGLLIVLVSLGAAIGFISYRFTGTRISKASSLSCETCSQLLEKPFFIDYALEGTIEKKKGDNVLFRINDEEILWVSLHPGYGVFRKDGETVSQITLDDIAVGSRVTLRGLGVSDLTENFLYTDRVEIQ